MLRSAGDFHVAEEARTLFIDVWHSSQGNVWGVAALDLDSGEWTDITPDATDAQIRAVTSDGTRMILDEDGSTEIVDADGTRTPLPVGPMIGGALELSEDGGTLFHLTGSAGQPAVEYTDLTSGEVTELHPSSDFDFDTLRVRDGTLIVGGPTDWYVHTPPTGESTTITVEGPPFRGHLGVSRDTQRLLRRTYLDGTATWLYSIADSAGWEAWPNVGTELADQPIELTTAVVLP
ncbi:MAG: hypothetical protein GY898_33270 [Proteobacteria bacterium]|nr:hypothetical protein [Pseudomonadota bacterium]